MRFFKSTGFLFVLVALVVGYAYIYEYKGKEKKEQSEIAERKIIPFSLEEIVEFRINANDKEYWFVKVEKDGRVSWNIKSPLEDIANYAAVQSFLSQFGQETFEEIAQEGPDTNFAIYGLDDSSKVNTIQFIRDVNDPSKNIKISIGAESGLGGKKYLRLNNENRVLVAGYFWESQLLKSFDEFRELNFVPHDFTFSEIEIRNKDDHYKLVQNDSEWVVHHLVNNEWKLNEVLLNDSDRAAIDNIYYQIKNLRATKIFREGKETYHLGRLGLSHPEIILVLSNGKEGLLRNEVRFQFSKNMAGQIYAISDFRNVIFSLNPPAVNEFKLTQAELRDKKKPLQIAEDEVDEIHFRSGFVSFKLKKDNEEWKSLTDIGEQIVDSSKVDELLEKLSTMKIKRYLDPKVSYQKSGMNELILKSKDNILLELEWAARPTDDFFVSKSNLSEELFAISMADIGSLPVAEVVVDSPKNKEAPKEGSHEDNS